MAAMSVALPSFDAFLRSARRCPAVLPRVPPSSSSFYRRPLSIQSLNPPLHHHHRRGYESPTTTSSPFSSSITPPGSPYYGYFVELSAASSTGCGSDLELNAEDTNRLSAMDDYPHFNDNQHQDQLAQHFAATASRPRAVVRGRANAAAARPARTSKKYLKERQRCEIVRRVRCGERQAHLAKEFGVSRAAVSYLLKHEEKILQRSALRQQRTSNQMVSIFNN